MAEYENLMMAQILQVKPGIENLGSDQVGQEFSMALCQLLTTTTKAMQSPKFPPGPGWELLSHETTKLGPHLVVSFLYRRQK